jgi:CDGSH-type Zn-finger protein
VVAPSGHYQAVMIAADDGSAKAESNPRVVRVTARGPMLVQGPVRIETPDGATVESDRFMVAICTCRRSKTYPLCDTSHRRRKRIDQDSADRSA